MRSGPEVWLGPLRRHGAAHDPGSVLGTVARSLASATGSAALRDTIDRWWPDGPPLPAEALPPPGAGPDALGWAHEALADRAQRRRGLHYTPPALADRLVGLALGLARGGVVGDGCGDGAAPSVCDPACGGGAFLLAVARRLSASGVAPAMVVERCVVGLDLDPVAVNVTRTALLLWCGDATVRPRVAQADALSGTPWPDRPENGFDVVVGNPPFQSQLGAETARSVAENAEIRAHLGGTVGGYVDTAALFLLEAVAQTRPRGRVALIQPQSVLAARDAAPVRGRLDEVAPLEGLWLCDERVFAAATHVCAPVLRVGGPPPLEVRRWRGPTVEDAGTAPRPPSGEWAPLAADLRGVPAVMLDADRSPAAAVLVEVGSATAGFRDEFYGLVPHVREATGAADERPLVTTGLIDPAECAWRQRPARFAKTRWQAPVVDLAALTAANPALSRWVEDRLVPKILVATQTRVVEVVVDLDGRWVPCTPVIAVPVDPERLWHVAAALSSPPATAWALRRSAGSALRPDALKLSAAQVRRAPAPVDEGAWDDGASLFRAAQRATSAGARTDALLAMGEAMTAAYGVEDGGAVLAWWAERLGRRGGPARSDIGEDGR